MNAVMGGRAGDKIERCGVDEREKEREGARTL